MISKRQRNKILGKAAPQCGPMFLNYDGIGAINFEVMMIKLIHDCGVLFLNLSCSRFACMNSIENLGYKRFRIQGEENFMPQALELSLG
jgi:hypothetical protein